MVDCTHPIEPEMNSLYGVIFVDDSDISKCHSKNICIFADGELDRSPTGTGVSARAAVERARGRLKKDEKIRNGIKNISLQASLQEIKYGKLKDKPVVLLSCILGTKNPDCLSTVGSG